MGESWLSSFPSCSSPVTIQLILYKLNPQTRLVFKLVTVNSRERFASGGRRGLVHNRVPTYTYSVLCTYTFLTSYLLIKSKHNNGS